MITVPTSEAVTASLIAAYSLVSRKRREILNLIWPANVKRALRAAEASSTKSKRAAFTILVAFVSQTFIFDCNLIVL